MAQSLVITLREGIEAALVIGIILVYLRQTGLAALAGYVYRAVALAVLASIAIAVGLEAVGLDPENPLIEGFMLGLAGLFVVSMVVWMWRAGGGMKRSLEGRLGAITAPSGSRATGVGLFLFAFLMVLREGVEMVFFLKAAALGEGASALSFLGGALGLALAGVFAVLFVRGSVQINLSRFFRVTSVALLVLGVKLLAQSAHEFEEAHLLPMSSGAAAFLDQVAGGELGALIVTAVVAVPILLLLWEILAVPDARIRNGQ